MTRDPQSLLAQEAKKRPVLADAIDRLDSLSPEDIMALPLIKWMRQALLSRQRLSSRQAVWNDTEMALEGHVVHGVNPDPLGEMRRWIGPDTFLRMDRGETEIRTGWLVWLPQTGGLLFQTMFSCRVDPRIAMQSVPAGTTTRSGYTLAYKAEVAARAPADAPVIFSNAGSGSTLSQYGVRIFR